ncbi:MAG: hypothetical protein A2086_12335 [Spirochaetes bacterium GWD1_27_9]|nr:MAG: hypothetical protein A2Z98_02165 [Spirochaetes bacterium GWB1_27_13]OHD20861.1 MAG: hypothetical protein A2Y34_08225 [Spirochaetes bacterium GWC1_27_15]OHD32580.1 MAG: hypothetical protein A2086_12335 [Spirochaetes bacterium GWD1_27_9]
MIQRKIFLLIFTLFVTLSVFGNNIDQTDDTLVIDLQKCLSLTKKNNLDLKIEDIKLNNKKTSLYTSWNDFLPKINGSTGIDNSIKPDKLTTSLKLNLNMSLSLNVSNFLNVNQTILDYKSSKITYNYAVKKVEIELTKSFYNILLSEEYIKIKNYSLKNSKNWYELAKKRYNNGEISEIDLLKSQYQYQNLAVEYENELKNHKISLLLLKQILNIDEEKEISIKGQIPEIKDFKFDELSKVDLTKNIDNQKLTFELESSKNQRNIKIANLTPSLSLGYSVGNSYTLTSNPNNNWDTLSSNFSVSISFSLDNLIPFSNTQMELLNTNSAITQNLIEIEKNKHKIKSDLLKIIFELKNTKDNFNNVVFNAEIAKKAYKLTENEYNNGEKSINDVIDGEEILNEANFKILSAKYDFIKNILDLELLLNTDLSGDKNLVN